MSIAEARRLIRQGAVRLNGEVVTSHLIPLEDFKEGSILQVGRKRFCRVMFARCQDCREILDIKEDSKIITCKCGARYERIDV